MEQRDFGRTGLAVSALGFGCGSIGGLMVRGDAAEQTRAVARAIAAGITYFDTAAQYGDGRSEQNLGRVLKELGAWGRVVVGTKAGIRTSDRPDLAGAVKRSLEQSLQRLGADSVDLLQLHSPTFLDDADAGRGLTLSDALGGVAEGMRQVVREGLARHVGFTGLGEPASVRQLAASGAFETMQAYFNALNPSAGFAGASGGAADFGGVIDVAAERGLGVIAIRVLAAGAVSGSAERPPNAGDPGFTLVEGSEFRRDLERAAALPRLAGEFGLESPLELALRFALAKRGVSTVLAGFSNLEQLESALRWAERGPLAEDAVRRVVDLAR